MKDLHPSDTRTPEYIIKNYLKDGVLNDRHKKFVRLMIAGDTASGAAEDVGWTRKYGIEVCRHPLIIKYRAKLEREIEKEFIRKESNVKEAHGIMVNAAPKAADTMVKNLVAKDNPIAQIRASENILETAGVMGKEKEKGQRVTIEVGPGFIEMLARNKEQKTIEDKPIDAEVIDG